MSFDTLIQNGDVITETGVFPLDVVISGEKIAALVARGTPIDARTRIDATGKYVLPGAIDIHFHCRAPDRPDRGDFATETRAAAAGGVTTVFEMPISKPCCATPEILRNRRAVGERDCYVNFGLFGAPGLLNRDQVHGMADEGAIAFKIFTTGAPIGRYDEFAGLSLPDDEQVYQALQLVAETGLVCTVHAENNRMLEWNMQRLSGRSDWQAHNESRPPMVEAVSIATLMTMNLEIGAHLHIAHVSSKLALDTFRRLKRPELDATAETCPHYLLFTEADLIRTRSFGKINPPLRFQEDQDALWEGVRDGTLLAITTDHSPFTYEEKEKTLDQVWKAPPGATGIEQLVLGVMDAALRGRLELAQAVSLISTRGAKRFGLYPNKGVIQVGADADLVIYDPRVQTTVDPEKLFTKAKKCDHLYAGMIFQGRIDRTLVNGRTVFADGEIVGQPGWGKFVRPDRSRIQTEI